MAPRLICLVAVAAFASACSSKDRRQSKSCAEETSRLRSWSTALAHEGLGGQASDALPMSSNPPRWLDYDIMLRISNEAILAGSAIVTDGNTTEAELRALLEPIWNKHAAPVRVAIAASKDAPWEKIVHVINTLWQLETSSISFVFRAESKAIKPPGALGSKDALDDAVKGCPPAHAVLERAAPLSLREKMNTIAEELPTAIQECNCVVDLNATRRALWQAMGRELGPTSTSIRIRAGTNVVIQAAANTPWRDMTERIEQAADKAVTLKVER